MSERCDELITERILKSDWEQREVYAHFGLALYFCQVLETQLVNYLVLLRRVRGRQEMTRDAVDALFERLFSGTLGRNLREVRDLLGGDWELADEMASVLRLRNELAHHWLRDRALDQGTSAARSAIVEELRRAQRQLQAADEKLTARTRELWDQAGLPRDWVEREYQRLRELADRGERDEAQ